MSARRKRPRDPNQFAKLVVRCRGWTWWRT